MTEGSKLKGKSNYAEEEGNLELSPTGQTNDMQREKKVPKDKLGSKQNQTAHVKQGHTIVLRNRERINGHIRHDYDSSVS